MKLPKDGFAGFFLPQKHYFCSRVQRKMTEFRSGAEDVKESDATSYFHFCFIAVWCPYSCWPSCKTFVVLILVFLNRFMHTRLGISKRYYSHSICTASLRQSSAAIITIPHEITRRRKREGGLHRARKAKKRNSKEVRDFTLTRLLAI